MAKNLGKVTAYAHAKAGGYTGTQDEFNAMLAGLDEYNEAAAQSAEEASGYAEEASGYVTEASGYADNASESASDAAGSVEQAASIIAEAISYNIRRFENKYTVSSSTSSFTFNPTGYTYSNGDRFEVYVNGSKLVDDEYTNSSNVITLTTAVSSGTVEIIGFKNVDLTTDTTLSLAGVAADAKKTGDEIDALKDDLSQISGLTDEIKDALLACFDNVAWKGGDGDDYYDALEAALYPVPWLWTYDSADGVLFQNYEHVTVASTKGEVSTSLGEGGMRFYAAGSATGNGVTYALSPNTSANAAIEAEVIFYSIPKALAGSGLMIMVGDGTYSAPIYSYHRISDDKYFLGTYEYYDGSMHWTPLYEIQLNTKYVLYVELSNGYMTLKVNGTQILHSNRPNKSSYYYTNCVNIGTPSDAQAGAAWFSMNWLRYKNLETGE